MILARDHLTWKHANTTLSGQSNLLINGSVKATHIVDFIVLLGGCATHHEADFSQVSLPPPVTLESDFVQGNIRITPPCTQDKLPNGEKSVYVYNEGGTVSIPMHDAKGRAFTVFVDHGMHSPTRHAIYLNAFPREPNSVRVIREDEFKSKIGQFITWPPWSIW